MRNPWHILLIFLFGVIVCGGADALDIYDDSVYLGNYALNDDVVIHQGVLFEGHNINIGDTLRIVNYGQISGGIDVCANCTTEIRNTGVFDATVSLQSGAKFIQVITANNEITNLGLGNGYGVVVRDGTGISLANVMQIASNANSIQFVNTRFNAGNTGGFVAPSNVKLSGDIFLNFDDVTTGSVLLFSGVSGDGTVYVDSNALDPLHVFQTYIVNGNDIYVHMVRSTDYARILNNDTGRFLNDLRASGADNKLFSNLDVAKSIGDINNILSHSIRTNPIKLMRPISMMHSHKMLEIMHTDNNMVLGVEPLLIFSSDVLMHGLRPSVEFNIDDLYLKISGYVMDIDYSDELNEYSGFSVGLESDAQYDMLNNNFVRAHFAGGKSYFNIGPVLSDGVIVNNPDGTSVYGIGEFGHNFDINNMFKISPFVAFGGEYVGVANTNDTTIYGAGGTNIEYWYDFDGIKYKYTVRFLVRTDGTYGAGINCSVWSIMDAAGADMHMGTIYNNDFGASLNVSLNGRFVF